MKKIKIVDVSDPAKLDDYISSSMVDIIYVVNIEDGTLFLTVENDIDLGSSKDREWVGGLISQALVDCHETNAKILFDL